MNSSVISPDITRRVDYAPSRVSIGLRTLLIGVALYANLGGHVAIAETNSPTDTGCTATGDVLANGNKTVLLQKGGQFVDIVARILPKTNGNKKPNSPKDSGLAGRFVISYVNGETIIKEVFQSGDRTDEMSATIELTQSGSISADMFTLNGVPNGNTPVDTITAPSFCTLNQKAQAVEVKRTLYIPAIRTN
ncbi:MAG: hypothetical protein WCO33_01215 [bacterium]